MLVAVSAPVPSAPSVSALASVIWVVVPVRLTTPWKSLAWVSVIVLAPALMPVVPATVSAPVCETGPPLLTAAIDAAVPLPRLSAPVLFAVSAPVFSVPSVNALVSLICAVAPVRLTAFWKSLADVSVIEPAPALTLLMPVTVSGPLCDTAPPLLVAFSDAAVPLPRLSAPVLVAVSAPVASAPNVSALMSLTCVVVPVRLTTPWKSLAWAIVIVLAPALMPAFPATSSAPLCVTAPPLLVAASEATVPLPRLSAPVLLAVSAPVVSVPSVSALTSLICVVVPARLTTPWKSFAEVRVIVLPAVTVVVPATRSAPLSLIALPAVATRFPVSVVVGRMSDAAALPNTTVRLFSPAGSVGSEAAALSLRRPMSWYVPPAKLTPPVKLLACVRSASTLAPATVSVTAPAPACCVIAPVCVTFPPARRFRVPLPMLDGPSTSAFVSPRATLFAPLLFKLTAPPKSLAGLARLIAVAALIVVVPATSRIPDCVTAPPELATRLPASDVAGRTSGALVKTTERLFRFAGRAGSAAPALMFCRPRS